MWLRWLLAALHLTALGIGLGAVWGRAVALRGPFDPAGLRRVFAADSWWGVAGFLYLKMASLLLLLMLEARAVFLLTRWPGAARRGAAVNTSAAPGLAQISHIQVLLVLVMLLAATAMARGLGQ
jgi:putative membrane protein